MGKTSAFLRDLFIEHRTIQNKILFPFIVFSFLAIVLVVLLVVQILSQRIEETTDRDILGYKETVEAFFKDKIKHTTHDGSLLASFRSVSDNEDVPALLRTMDISHMDMLTKEGVQIYVKPERFMQSGNRAQREMVKRGLQGEEYGDLIFKSIDGKTRLDFDIVIPYESRGYNKIVIVGFSFDDAYLEEIKSKVKNDLFILHHDRIIASTIGDPASREKIQSKVTGELISRTLEQDTPTLAKVYLSNKEYKSIFAPLSVGNKNKAVFGLVMSTNDLALAKRKVILNYIAVSLAIMLILTLINFLVVNAISRPLKEIAALTDKVAQGDLTQRIHIQSKDELSTLADSFNNMVDSLERNRKELNLTVEQLIHQEKFASLGEMAAGIAHEVGNPLSVIVGYSKMLLRKCSKGEQADLLKRISEAALRIDKLSKSLLLYSRPSEQTPEAVDVNGVIDDALTMVEHRFKEEKNYRVVKRLSKNLHKVTGSADRLQQVFVNLFINAFQAMPDGGTLTLSTENAPDNTGILIEVGDTGTGIPADKISKIFDPFFSTKFPDKGTGLGLSITLRIITDHGGIIRAASEPDKGTTFFIRLPSS
ncbi:MAG: ATP-binding protein [bacterium]|nr:ATP-binding protein [bacterium]